MTRPRKPNRGLSCDLRPRGPSVADALRRRYGDYGGAPPRPGSPPTERDVRPMGPLVELHVERLGDGRVEKWVFDPKPRLVFNRRTKRMWILGGGFRVDGRGFHATGRATCVRRLPLAEGLRDPSQAPHRREWARTRNGAAPQEFLLGVIRAPGPGPLVPLGHLEAAVYETDRNDGDGYSEWIHAYEDEGLPGVKNHRRPLVCTDARGSGIWFCGGTYSVIDGWLGG